MASRMVRTRGMQAPYASDQISALVLHPIISVGFVVMSAISLEPRRAGIVLAPFVALNTIMGGLWGYISWVDPAGEGGCSVRSKGGETPHYCNFCRKTVKGFDHHCSWLNTCISARNYAHFYLLGVSGSLLYLYMSAVGVMMLIWANKDDQRDAFGSLTASRIAWGVFIGVAGWIAVSFVALAGFHTYLLLIGLGTYDWVVLQNQKRQEKLATRRTGYGASRSRCCGGGGSVGQRPPVSTGSAQDGAAISTSAAGQPLSNGSSKAKGRWGGAGLGVGVTPPRSRGLSNSNTNSAGGTRPASAGATSGGGGLIQVPLDP